MKIKRVPTEAEICEFLIDDYGWNGPDETAMIIYYRSVIFSTPVGQKIQKTRNFIERYSRSYREIYDN